MQVSLLAHLLLCVHSFGQAFQEPTLKAKIDSYAFAAGYVPIPAAADVQAFHEDDAALQQ